MSWNDLVDYEPCADPTPPTSASSDNASISAPQTARLMQTTCTLDEIINEEKRRRLATQVPLESPRIPKRRHHSPLKLYRQNSFKGQDTRTARSWKRAAPYIDLRRTESRPRSRRRHRSASTDESSSETDSGSAPRRRRHGRRTSDSHKGKTIINVMQGGVLVVSKDAGPTPGYFAGIPNAMQDTSKMLTQYAYDKQQLRPGLDVTEIHEEASSEVRTIIDTDESAHASPVITGTVRRRAPAGIVHGEIIELE